MNDLNQQKKGGRRLNSSTELIRQAAAALGTFARRQLMEAGFSEVQVKTGLETLIRQGRVRRTGFGRYEFVRERRRMYEAPLEERIWHAMRINPSWSCSDIAVQSGTSTSYIYKRLRVYRAEDYVSQHGVRQVPGGAERLWRLTKKGRDHLNRPDVEIFEPDPMVVLATRINRLVATGMAVRFTDARNAAIAACEDLITRLREAECLGTMQRGARDTIPTRNGGTAATAGR